MNKAATRSLRLKITLLLCLILPFNALGLISSKLSYDSALNRVQDVITYTMNTSADRLRQRIADAEATLYDTVENDSSFITAARQDGSWLYEFSLYQVNASLEQHISSGNTADQFFFYMNKIDDLIQIPYTYDSLPADAVVDLIGDYSENIGKWILIEHQGKHLLLKTNYDPIFDVFSGYCIDLQRIVVDLQSAIEFESMTFAFSGQPLTAGDDQILWNTPIMDGLYLNASVSRSEMGHSINPLQYIIFALFFLSLLLVPVLLSLMQRYMIRPLKDLNRAHDQLAEGNEDYRITTVPSSSEFDSAFRSFNHMAATLQALRRDVVNKELANKQLQIDYLQLQIRPHFLLNTFNVLFTLIQNNEREQAQLLILYLSDYFRYIFRSGHELQPFSKELKLIQGYLDVAKIYYPNAFTISYQIDPLLEQMQVPPLMLHSFVENIIQHALLPGKTVHIVLSGEWTDECVTFRISDDGSGMTPETVERISHLGDLSDGRNVGLKNSVGRLRHYFGEGAGISVDSREGEGTTFTIQIPYRLEEAEDEFTAG